MPEKTEIMVANCQLWNKRSCNSKGQRGQSFYAFCLEWNIEIHNWTGNHIAACMKFPQHSCSLFAPSLSSDRTTWWMHHLQDACAIKQTHHRSHLLWNLIQKQRSWHLITLLQLAACSPFGLHVYLLAPASNHDPFQLLRCLRLHPLHHCHLGTPHHLTADLLFVRIPKTAAR
jgi:hypothetical protein